MVALAAQAERRAQGRARLVGCGTLRGLPEQAPPPLHRRLLRRLPGNADLRLAGPPREETRTTLPRRPGRRTGAELGRGLRPDDLPRLPVHGGGGFPPSAEPYPDLGRPAPICPLGQPTVDSPPPPVCT